MRITDFKGMNTQEPEIQADEARVAKNCILSYGTIKTIKRTVVDSTIDTTSVNKTVHSMQVFKTFTGIEQRLAFTDGVTAVKSLSADAAWANNNFEWRVKYEYRNTGYQTLTNYPVNEVLSAEEKAKCRANGIDIEARTTTGVLLNCWVKAWDTGKIDIRIPEIQAGASVVFYLYYGSATDGAGQGKAGVYQYAHVYPPAFESGSVNDGYWDYYLSGATETFDTTIPIVSPICSSYAFFAGGGVDSTIRFFIHSQKYKGLNFNEGLNSLFCQAIIGGNYFVIQKATIVSSNWVFVEVGRVVLPGIRTVKIGSEYVVSFSILDNLVQFSFCEDGVFFGSGSYTLDFSFNNTIYCEGLNWHNITREAYVWHGTGLPTPAPILRVGLPQQKGVTVPFATLSTHFKNPTQFYAYSAYGVDFLVDKLQRIKLYDGSAITDLCPTVGSLWVTRRGEYITGNKERIFISTAGGNRIWFTNAGKYSLDADWKNTAAIENFFDVPSTNGQKITGMEILFDRLIIFCENSVYCLYGNDPDAGELQLMNVDCGCVAPRSIANTGKGIYFLSSLGVRYLSGSTAGTGAVWSLDNVLARSMSDKIKPDMDKVVAGDKGMIQGIATDEYYYLASTIAEITTVFVADVKRGRWTTYHGFNVASWLKYPDTNEIYYGDFEGRIWKFNTTQQVGDECDGGIIIYISDDKSVKLIAAKTGLGTGSWHNGSDMVTDALGTTLWDGKNNTDKIISVQGNTGNYAAKLCRDYRGGGYADWYLPSNEELGILLNHKEIVGITTPGAYWSSTEYSLRNAWVWFFDGGNWTIDYKNNLYNVWAVRMSTGVLVPKAEYHTGSDSRGTPSQIKRWKGVWVEIKGECKFTFITDQGDAMIPIPNVIGTEYPTKILLKPQIRGRYMQYKITELVGEIFSIEDVYESYRAR
ncbi:MAG: DUF1566 domain-containing protein [Candidatus Omnitrophota bacterium]